MEYCSKSDAHALQRALFRPKTVALVGASSERAKASSRPLRYLRTYGYGGDVFVVNRARRGISGTGTWSSIKDIPVIPDHAFIMVPTDAVVDAVTECVGLGVPVVTVLAGGFGEAGPLGMARQEDLAKVIADSETRLVGPSSIGVVNTYSGFVMTASAAFDHGDQQPGGLFIGSHSGGLVGALDSRAATSGVGLNGLVSSGGELDLSVGELCLLTVDDCQIDRYALFLESLKGSGHLREFAVAAAERGKPIVAYKVGRSQEGAELAKSHTGAIAGDDAVAGAFLRDCGIPRVDTLEGLLQLPGLLTELPVNAEGAVSGSVSVVTTTGGGGGMLVDQLSLHGVNVSGPGPALGNALRRAIPGAQISRLVDLTLGGTSYDDVRRALSLVRQQGDSSLVIMVIGASARSDPGAAVQAVVDERSSSGCALACFVVPAAAQSVRTLCEAGVPTFQSAYACADAVSAGISRTSPRILGRPKIESAFDGRTHFLNEVEAYRMLDGLEIPHVSTTIVEPGQSASDVELRYPVAAKILSDSIVHKLDVGGVELGVSGPEDLDAAMFRIRKSSARESGNGTRTSIVVEPMISGVGEVLLSYTRDSEVGSVVTLAAGGEFAEVYDDATTRLAPVTRDIALSMIDDISYRRVLSGFRGRRKGDLGALCEAIVKISHADSIAGVRQIELNPLVVSMDGEGVMAVDALVEVES